MPAVHAEGLFKVFGRRPGDAVRRLQDGASIAEVRERGATPAVVDVGFTVEPGEIFVVMGLSGSGKSTLIRMLNGLLEPTAGRVTIGDAELTSLDARGVRRLRQERMSMVFQHFALFPHRTVLDNAAYALEVRGVDRTTRRARALEALAEVGLAERADARPDELSGGMKQRVGLARALAAETDLLLMDEAFSALDPLIRREMQDQLLDLQSRLGKTIVFITHDLNEAMRLGDRVMVMRDGRVVQLGTPEQILDSPADDYVASFLADVDRGRVFTAEHVMAPAPVVLAGGSSPAAALDAMHASHTSSALVVDGFGQLTGTVGEGDAQAAVDAGQVALTDGAVHPSVTVGPETLLSDLLVSAGQDEHLVAVVDDTNQLLGVVPPTAVLAALGGATADPPTTDLTKEGPRG
ncbi:glycine betaine/proline transport system ATP-binding protein [Modestobacter roseus]|uniref:Glycine betaine/proline transport system ATP-binding protein n=1 Tax=Modestobacter roseus TaxID=1181884 RepID=A0A562IXP4_9ACTN|nr:glycine betaine/L-proline ABC transporter ATP-binding protein [Modestobacter roseus]MQA32745.1 betaine/proline/choline family ABC transporter ATP-binding protein [Modestobacter roseus]TWH75737.1 glycine betaine/proline transport system ATP-binding protein [Modestobacter roseus]